MHVRYLPTENPACFLPTSGVRGSLWRLYRWARTRRHRDQLRARLPGRPPVQTCHRVNRVRAPFWGGEGNRLHRCGFPLCAQSRLSRLTKLRHQRPTATVWQFINLSLTIGRANRINSWLRIEGCRDKRSSNATIVSFSQSLVHGVRPCARAADRQLACRIGELDQEQSWLFRR